MKQETVFLHTAKTMEDAEKIFKENGIEVIFKRRMVRMNYDELTQEEQRTLINERKPNLSELQNSLESLQKRIEDSMAILNVVQTSPMQKPDTLHPWINFDLLHNEIDAVDDLISPMTNSTRWRDDQFDHRVDCGIIIGNYNGQHIRFLEFRENDDPIITITGNDPNPIKDILEQNF